MCFTASWACACWYIVTTAILIIIKGQFQAFQRFSINELVLKTVEYRFTPLECQYVFSLIIMYHAALFYHVLALLIMYYAALFYCVWALLIMYYAALFYHVLALLNMYYAAFFYHVLALLIMYSAFFYHMLVKKGSQIDIYLI